MSLGDIIILAALFLWLLLSLRYMRKRRKNGKCIGCGGDCSACHGSCHPACRSRQTEEVKQPQKQRTERKETQKIDII